MNLSTPSTPSSADLREAARRLAMAEADGIHNADDARAVAAVATWLHAMADAADDRRAQDIAARLCANIRRSVAVRGAA